MVRMMPEILLSLSYYGISTVKNGLIRLRLRKLPRIRTERERVPTVCYGLLRSSRE